MKTLFATLFLLAALLAVPGKAAAYCTTHTYIIDGRLMTCITCCDYDGGNCTTNCI